MTPESYKPPNRWAVHNRCNRRRRAEIKAEIQQLRAERGPFWRPAYSSPLTHPSERSRAEAIAEIDAAWHNESRNSLMTRAERDGWV